MTTEHSAISNGGPEQQDIQEKPLIDVLVENALERHSSQRSFIGRMNAKKPYYRYNAAEDAVKNSDKSPGELFASLTSQTTVKPRDLLGHEMLNNMILAIASGDIDNWDEFKIKVSSMIIDVELGRRHPEVVNEDRKRYNESRKLIIPPKLG